MDSCYKSETRQEDNGGVKTLAYDAAQLTRILKTIVFTGNLRFQETRFYTLFRSFYKPCFLS